MAEIEIGSLITGAPTRTRSKSRGVSAMDPRKSRSARTEVPAAQTAPTRSAPKPKPKPKKKAKPDLAALKREAESVMSSMTELPDEEAAQLEQYQHMFTTLVDIAQALETRILGSTNSRDVYPLMQTYNQIREVIADMRALRDMGSIGDRVNQEILYPFVQSAAKDAGEFYQSITRQCKRLLPPELFEQVDLLLREEFQAYGGKLQASYTGFLDKTATLL